MLPSSIERRLQYVNNLVNLIEKELKKDAFDIKDVSNLLSEIKETTNDLSAIIRCYLDANDSLNL